MGNTKTTTNSTQTATATPQEQQLEKNQLDISNANLPNQMSINNNSANLINSILTGNYTGTAAGITPQQNQSMVNQSLRDIAPQFQTSGILNSGEAGQVASQTAALTSNANAQFNTQAQSNLLSQALGGGTNWSSTSNQNNATMGSELAGLRTVNSSNVVSSNPFLNAFYTGLGNQASTTIGNAANAAIGSSTGGANGMFAKMAMAGGG